MQQKNWLALAVLCAVFLFFPSAHAEDYVITLKDHQFSPSDLSIPANQKIKLTVKNLGPDKAEFESSDLDREQIVDVDSAITVFIGPVDAGSYGYFDDFHRETVGTITAK